MAGYIRQSAGQIVSGQTIQASHFNNEYNALQSAFDATSGHTHDGSAGGGALITSLGTIATGVWNGTVITGAYGGTGVANTSKTITLGGNLTTSGSFNTTLTVTADSNVTFPTTGTLATRTGTETLTNKTLTSPTINGGTASSVTMSGSSINSSGVGLVTPAAGAFLGLSSTLLSGGGIVRAASDGELELSTGIVTADISNNQVTYGKMQQVTALRMLGNITGSTTNVTEVNLNVFALTANNLSDLSDAAAARTNLGLAIGTNVQAYDADLGALAANSTNGIWSRTGAGTGSARTITASGTAITITNGDGVSGNPTVGLTTLTANNVLLGNGTNTPQVVAPGTSGNVLTSNGTTWTSAAVAIPVLSVITNSLGADVNLNNTGAAFDGPSVAQGTTGKWFASGTVTLLNASAATNYTVILTDGVTNMASARINTDAAGRYAVVALSGYIETPAGNIRIKVQDTGSTAGKIIYNATTLGKDSTITAIRIG